MRAADPARAALGGRDRRAAAAAGDRDRPRGHVHDHDRRARRGGRRRGTGRRVAALDRGDRAAGVRRHVARAAAVGPAGGMAVAADPARAEVGRRRVRERARRRRRARVRVRAVRGPDPRCRDLGQRRLRPDGRGRDRLRRRLGGCAVHPLARRPRAAQPLPRAVAPARARHRDDPHGAGGGDRPRRRLPEPDRRRPARLRRQPDRPPRALQHGRASGSTTCAARPSSPPRAARACRSWAPRPTSPASRTG